MTTTSTASYITYSGDDSTTTFAIPFSFNGDAEIDVTLITDSTNDAVLQTITTHYTISGTNVEMVAAPATGETLVIELDVTESQATDYVANDSFPAETHEAALDKLTRMVKQLRADFDNLAVKLPTNKLTSTTVTDTDIGASKVFRVNSAGTAVELATVSALTGGGDSWSDEVDSDIIPDTDNTYDLGSAARQFTDVRAVNLYGTLGTAAQTSVTSLGTLTSVTIDNITIDGNTISTSSGNVESSEIFDLSGGTAHVILPTGTTAQRTGTTAGQLRWNSTDGKLEAYSGSAWVQYTSGGSAGQSWSDPIDAAITVDADSTYDVGTSGARLKDLYADNLYGAIAEAAQTNITSVGTLTALTVDNIVINGNDISSSSGAITFSPTGVVDMTASTDHFLPPTGTTAQRSGTTAGQTRYNTTDNKLEYYNGSAWVQLADSTAGAWKFIDSTTVSGGTEIDLDNVMDSTYDVYWIVLPGATVGTDGVTLRGRVGTGATPTYQTGATDYLDGSANADYLHFSGVHFIGNASGESCSLDLYIYSPSDSSINTLIKHEFSTITNGSNSAPDDDTQSYTANTAVTSFRIYPSSGTITGTAYIYGLSKT